VKNARKGAKKYKNHYLNSTTYSISQPKALRLLEVRGFSGLAVETYCHARKKRRRFSDINALTPKGYSLAKMVIRSYGY